MLAALVLAAVVGGLQPADGEASAQVSERIAAIVVHGNQIVTDEEVLKIAGVAVGEPFTDKTIAEVSARLKASRKFESVEVLKRYASIDDFSQIAIVINASEGAVRITNMLPGLAGGLGGPHVVKRGMWRSLMGMMILDAEDGYGVTYGARLAYPKVLGARSRISFPLTWGGTRKAGVELEKSFTSGPFSRLEFGGAIQQRRNPAYDIADRRDRVWARAEKTVGDFRAGGNVGWQRVKFGSSRDDIRSVGVDATIDTRLDASLPRNAVFVQASVEQMFLKTDAPIAQFFNMDERSFVRTRIDARGYLGLFGQQVLVGRVLREDANRPQPLYLRSLLGGWSNLRGFEAGFQTGDTLVATSIEWRMPISSPLSFGKLGISVFADWGTAYEKGERFRDQTLHRGIGAGAWMTLTGLRFGLAVAHGKGAGTRVSFSGGINF